MHVNFCKTPKNSLNQTLKKTLWLFMYFEFLTETRTRYSQEVKIAKKTLLANLENQRTLAKA